MKWWPFETDEALIASLFDKDWKTRDRAKASLDRKYPGWPKSDKVMGRVADFIAALENKDGYFRETAAEVLGLMGDRSAVEPLVAVLKDPIARQAAARALGLIGDRRATGPLVEAQTIPDRHFKNTALDALAKIDPDWPQSPEAHSRVSGLIASLKNGDAALDALARIDPDWKTSEEARKQIPAFIACLNDEDMTARKAAAEVLKHVGDHRATDSLINLALNDADETVRKTARSALEKRNPGWAETAKVRGQVPKFVAALDDKNEAVRKAAAEALVFVGDERAVGPLIRTLKDRNEEIGMFAVEALTKIDPLWAHRKEVRKHFAELVHLVEYGNGSNHARQAAVKALGVLGDAGALDTLLSQAHARFDNYVHSTEVADWPYVAATFRNDDVHEAIEKIIVANRPLKDGSDAFCLSCFHRHSKTIEIPRIVSVSLHLRGEISVPVCGRCRSSLDLIAGIKTVVGIIGGDMPRFRQTQGSVEIPVWDEQEKRTLPADIDSLIIRADGIGNYHYAINAVIIELTADTSKPGDWLKSMPVILEGEPALGAETVNMLRDIFDF